MVHNISNIALIYIIWYIIFASKNVPANSSKYTVTLQSCTHVGLYVHDDRSLPHWGGRSIASDAGNGLWGQVDQQQGSLQGENIATGFTSVR